ncbi:MAG: AraC family transcriptional regulator [Pseudomonadota bacterium]
MARQQSFGAISPDSIAELAEEHPEVPTEFNIKPSSAVLARGDMNIFMLRDDVKIMRGRLRGLRNTVVGSTAEPGLHIEARLSGTSSSRSVEGKPINLEMLPGHGHILGLRAPVSWQVHVPAQEAMEVASVRFPQKFIANIRGTTPGIARRMQETIAGDQLHMVELNTELLQMTREILELTEHSGFNAMRIESLALSMLAAMYELVDNNAGPFESPSSSVMSLVENLIESSAPRIWTIKALGDELGLSMAKIKRAAIAEEGISIGAYLSQKRLEAARTMLARPLSIAEIAVATGYGTTEAFSKAFFNKFGVSPTGYREELRQTDSALI